MSVEGHTQLDASLDEAEVDEPGAFAPTISPEEGARDSGVLPAGARLGRYVVLDRLGAGGMGVVYAAWDPRLDRKLALKLLIGPAGGSRASEGQARLLREAQALARLVHPNVVSVHDVGTVEGRVFIAMEFVEGQSLRAWLDAAERSVSEILAIFTAAGRGLAAAHAAGLIHRDFKPDNVMVGADGRVRVLDFGLARRGDDLAATTHEPDASPTGSLHDSREDSLGSLTRTGVLIGTPAYMSPEQFRGDPLDARSDQFSFCVALWEALAGERPYSGEHRVELATALIEGRRRPFPRARVPEALVRVLERGLDPDPRARWPDMAELLDALAPAPRRRRSTWIAAASAGLALLLGLGLGFGMLGDRRTDEDSSPVQCEVDEARLEGIWDTARAAELERAFAATKLPWAEASAARVREQLDAWTQTWRAAVEDACVAHHVRHEQSAELFDLRMACLDQRLRALDSLVDLLIPEEPDPAIVERAIAASASLGSVDACSDPERLRATAPPEDPELAARVAELASALDRREQMQDLGMNREALREDERLRPELEALDHPASWARAWLLRALDLIAVGEPEAALEAATAAVAAGRRASPADTLGAVLVLTRVTLRTGRFDESERWLILGEAIGEEVDDPRLHFELLKARGFLARVRADLPAALDAFERSLALAREHFGADSYEVATELSLYGDIAIMLVRERPELAELGLAAQREALEVMGRTFPAEHPTTILIRLNLVEALLRNRRREEALAELEALAALVEDNYEPDHELHLSIFVSRAQILQALNRCTEAFAEFDAYFEWLATYRPKRARLHVQARANGARACGGSHPRAPELLDEAVAAGFPEGEPAGWWSLVALFARAQVRLDRGLLDEAAADLARLRELAEARPELLADWRASGQIPILFDLLALRREPRAELRSRLAAHRAELDPRYDRYMIALIDRSLASSSVE